jgi:CDP-glycerol glycerophosphotransferase
VWLAVARHAAAFPPDVHTVPYGSPEAVTALEAADVVVANTHTNIEWSKGPGTLYLQTWHGTPLKTVHRDILWSPPGLLDYQQRDVDRWDVLVSPNRASTPRLRQAFTYEGEVLETGYPRNDVLSAPDRDERRAQLRERLGIPDGTTAVLLLRLHYMVTEALPPARHPSVRDVSLHPDVSELYLAADVLVTDYSSTMFDFAVTGRPMAFLTYDLADFQHRVRGFYFELADEAPGPLVETTSALIDVLRDLDGMRSSYAGRYARFRERYCHLEDGRATQRVLERLAQVRA